MVVCLASFGRMEEEIYGERIYAILVTTSKSYEAASLQPTAVNASEVMYLFALYFAL